MRKKRSAEEWMNLVNEYKVSNLTLSVWCRKNEISKSSIYPYIKKYEESLNPSAQSWGEITIPKNTELSPISLKIGDVTLDIKSGFDKQMLADILRVVRNQC